MPCDGRCCDLHEVPLTDQDVQRLAEHTGRSVADFTERTPDGWVLLRGAGVDPDGCVFRGTVVFEGRAVPACTVHEARPEACRTYPFVLREDGTKTRVVARDGSCPFRDGFEPPAGIEGRLVGLWDRLRAERRARQAELPATTGAPPV